MDNISYNDEAMASAGLPYDNINWYSIAGQPFGTASKFNVIIFNDANNIVDVEGPVAIGGSFYSPRGLSVGFVRRGNKEVSYSPDLVRFLVGGNVSMTGPLVVIGHVVVGGGFRAAKGSTYLIGKGGINDGIQELKFLYQANGGSQYWTPSDKGDHYVVPSYDVPRYIPASRIGADLPRFFNEARENIGYYKDCIEALTPNGVVVDNNFEWILRGNDPVQNVFLIDVRPNGLINKGIRAEVPQGSRVIVRLRTGANAHLQYGVYGERSKANQTLYLFEDASNIYMEKSSDIWGSILAPQAMFHAHSTGGHVSGNAALGSFAVNAESGFEFHYFPFVGGVECQGIAPAPVVPTPEVPQVLPESEEQPAQVCPECPVCPAPTICPPQEPCPTCPVPQPCPPPEPCPIPEPCPTCPAAPPCPEPEPCPTCPTCPTCPACPAPLPCPEPEPCPVCPPPTPCPPCPVCPECPEPTPCPPCPVCPEPTPCPACPVCPEPTPCPACPVCPECPAPEPCPPCPEPETIFIPVPIPVPAECPEPEPCPVCEECLIKPCIIMGCIWGCRCDNFHDWDVKLYERCNGIDTFLCCLQINGCGCFKFTVPFEGLYVLKVRLSDSCSKTYRCKPVITFSNIGVECFMIE
ncbi:collagen-binding domain-containing protein [Lacrimispora indolis]|uniref:collagen-binding domain-containing protein n=1 Tax=Lacrimispora indolis TaxID=69825 RepID=UPI000422739F|nr:collagen-binding domain-containing protein [[Clostridium] methoxybenzovorans]